jgi:predicted Rossmann fold nucleotide-binding protein DprA/Smf involved in DNA uptake
MDDDDVARDAKPDPDAVSDPGVTLIDDGTWAALERMPAPSAGEVAAAGGSTAVAVLDKVASEIVDAIVVEDDPADQILAAIGSSPTGVKAIVSATGLPRSSVYRHLDKLKSQGHIASGGRGIYVRTGGE